MTRGRSTRARVSWQDPVVGGDEAGADHLGVLGPLLGQPLGGHRHPFRRVPPARRTRRRQERGIGLDQQPIGRDDPGHLGARLLARAEDEPAERDREAEIEDRPGIVDRPGERVDDRRWSVPEAAPGGLGPERRPELADEEVLGVASAGPGPTVEDGRLGP